MKPEQEHEQRVVLADMIERRAHEVVARWLEQVRADAADTSVPLTELADGIHDYLTRLAELLRGGDSLDHLGASAWDDVAREHAITRVRLGFDITQLFHEIGTLQRITIRVLREQGALDDRQADRLRDLIDAAMKSSLKSYIDYRDYLTRKTEAEHIGFLTHELKNPLNAVFMAAERLRQLDLPAAQQRLCDIIERNLGRVRRMIDDVLLTERLQIGEVENRPVEVTLGQLIGDALEVFNRAAEEKAIRLVTSFDPALTLRADPTLTSSAIENLIDNAIRYTDVGVVTFAVEDDAESVVFHVRDTCNGLSPEELRVIFEPFKRVHSRKPGTGRGLAIARRAIETQGGTIHAESSADAGCHFWFVLPRLHH
jgi:two-component system, NarL family, sensor histidine kinase BarA